MSASHFPGLWRFTETLQLETTDIYLPTVLEAGSLTSGCQPRWFYLQALRENPFHLLSYLLGAPWLETF